MQTEWHLKIQIYLCHSVLKTFQWLKTQALNVWYKVLSKLTLPASHIVCCFTSCTPSQLAFCSLPPTSGPLHMHFWIVFFYSLYSELPLFLQISNQLICHFLKEGFTEIQTKSGLSYVLKVHFKFFSYCLLWLITIFVWLFIFLGHPH